MPSDHQLIQECFQRYQEILRGTDVSHELIAFKTLCANVRANGRKLLLAGNGASAAIAGHLALDFTKQAKVRAISFNDPALITAFTNDYGQEMWIAKAIEHYADPGDVAVLISSSGRSPNVVQAAKSAKSIGLNLVTFTGFHPENPLRQLGDISFWADSNAYQIVECIHMIWATIVVDLVIGKLEYGV